jgi:pimeloyl-ACP methyl ester carboxylesterase
MTQTVTSPDGTTIAFEKTGSGPAVIVIGGAFNTRQSAADIAAVLAVHFSVYSYDRRGRGDSSDNSDNSAASSAGGSAGANTAASTSPASSMELELQDLAVLIDAAGGSAALYGHSSGGILALEAAASGLPVTQVAAFEPPLVPAANIGTMDQWRAEMRAAVDADDRERAAKLFLQGTGADQATIDGMSQLPWWQGMLAIAHTLPYDLALLGDGTVPAERYAAINVPTVVLYGSDSFPWAADVATRVSAAVPDAKTVAIQGQNHDVDAATIAPALTELFLAG